MKKQPENFGVSTEELQDRDIKNLDVQTENNTEVAILVLRVRGSHHMDKD